MTHLAELRVSGYRSLRDVRVPLGRISVIVGANGTGKTNVYSALRLAQHAAIGTLGRAIVDEGGLPSMLWAGQRARKEEARIRVAVTFEDFAYEMSVGFVPAKPPAPGCPPGPFDRDPEVKEERIAPCGQSSLTLLERKGGSAWARDADGSRVVWPFQLWGGESVLSQIREPGRFPLGAELAMRFAQLRFYHQFPIERGSAIRLPQLGVRTGLLSDDGRDLAAAVATIEEIGDAGALHRAIDSAFPGARLHVDAQDGMFSLTMKMPGIQRPFSARELSDGTLRFLCLAVALTAPRPPVFLALNEPEASLHPDVLPVLAERIVACASTTQVLVTTHSRPLADAIASLASTTPMELVRERGETRVVDGDSLLRNGP